MTDGDLLHNNYMPLQDPIALKSLVPFTLKRLRSLPYGTNKNNSLLPGVHSLKLAK